jgi:hypothetical protein
MGTMFSSGEQLERIVRVLFLGTILNDSGSLREGAREVIKWLYNSLAIEPQNSVYYQKRAESLEPG